MEFCLNSANQTDVKMWFSTVVNGNVPIPEFSSYFLACALTLHDQSDKVIQLSLEKLKCNLSNTEKALHYNLMAYSFAKKNKKSTSLHYARKAIASCPSECPVLEILLYNVVAILKNANNYDASIKLANILLSKTQLPSIQATNCETKYIQFHVLPSPKTDRFAQVTEVQISHRLKETYITYLIGKLHLLNLDFSKAFQMLSKATNIEGKAIESTTAKHPTQLCIQAEMLFAAVNIGRTDIAFTNDDYIHYNAIEFKKAIAKLSYKNDRTCKESISNLTRCINRGSELFYHLSIELFRSKLFPYAVCKAKFKAIIQELEFITPFQEKQVEFSDADANCRKYQQKFQSVITALHRTKAKILFNNAFLLSLEIHPEVLYSVKH